MRNITDTEISWHFGKRKSEGSQLKQQLEELLGTLDRNVSIYLFMCKTFSLKIAFISICQQNHFIRCLKANDAQKCDLFDEQIVEQQLVTSGSDVLLQNERHLWQCR